MAMILNGHKLIALVGLLASLLNLATTTTHAATPTSGVTLAWDPSPGTAVAGYRIYQGVVSQTYTNSIDVGNVTSYTVTNLVPGVTYFFAVSAYDSNKLESPLSVEVSYTVPTTPAPLARLHLGLAPTKQALISGTGLVGQKFDIQAASNLTNWTTIATVTVDASGAFQFTDPASSTNSARFYRVRLATP